MHELCPARARHWARLRLRRGISLALTSQSSVCWWKQTDKRDQSPGEEGPLRGDTGGGRGGLGQREWGLGQPEGDEDQPSEEAPVELRTRKMRSSLSGCCPREEGLSWKQNSSCQSQGNVNTAERRGRGRGRKARPEEESCLKAGAMGLPSPAPPPSPVNLSSPLLLQTAVPQPFILKNFRHRDERTV